MNLTLKRTPGLYLVGFMGSGKTTIGRRLGDRLGWHFVDLDDDIEAAAQATVNEIFEKRGEPEFRRLEHQALRERVRRVETGYPTVLALGGGAYVQEGNRVLLAGNGITLWLDCPLDRMRRRVEPSGTRPLARDPERFAALYEARRALYAMADIRIPIEGDDPEAAVETILQLPLFR